MEALQAHLIEMYAEGKSPVVILDEAQLMRGKQFEIIRQFTNFETNDTKLLQIILTGQLELRNKLRMKKALVVSDCNCFHAASPFPGRDGRHDSFSGSMWPGGTGTSSSRNALERVYELSKGIPKRGNKALWPGLETRSPERQEKQITR